MSKREDGFFWIIYKGEWVVAELLDGHWWTTRSAVPVGLTEDQIGQRVVRNSGLGAA